MPAVPVGYQVAAKEAWERLNAWLAQHQVRRQVKRGFGLFHDNPQVTPLELLRYDACVGTDDRSRRRP